MISDAVKNYLFPSRVWTKAVRELEKEMGITAFSERTNRGNCHIYPKRGEFLGHADSSNRHCWRKHTLLGGNRISVSTQHWPEFAVNGRNRRAVWKEKYDFNLVETQTYEIMLEDVADEKRRSNFIWMILTYRTWENCSRNIWGQLPSFLVGKPYIFVSTKPQGKKPRQSKNWSRIRTFLFGNRENTIFTSPREFRQCAPAENIRVADRNLFNLPIGLNGYTACSVSIGRGN